MPDLDRLDDLAATLRGAVEDGRPGDVVCGAARDLARQALAVAADFETDMQLPGGAEHGPETRF